MDKKMIIYDFDGTLTPYRIPIYPIMKKAFSSISLMNTLRMLSRTDSEKKRDFYEWYYNSLFKLLKLSQIPINLENLTYGAKEIKFNPGVVDFFKAFRENNPEVKHIILTSGLEAFVKATEISPLVDDVRGTRLNFVDDGVKLEHLVTNFQKIKIIKEITGGDCTNVIYVGDGMTDVPAFNYVNQNGGENVLLTGGRDSNKILSRGIINKFVDPDFSSGSKLCKYLTGDNK